MAPQTSTLPSSLERHPPVGLHKAPDPQVSADGASMTQLRRKLFAFALRELRNPEVAEDVTQETMIALFMLPNHYRGDARFDVYAIGVLRHKITDHFRAGRREVAVAPETIDALREDAEENASPADLAAGDPAERIDAHRSRDRFWQTLREGLASLPETTRAAFVLRDVQEWSMSAVCAHLGVTPTHVSVMAHRARAHLKAHWAQCDEAFAHA
jgi:RNA polymerase sigma-70 factor, ECF subfamily